MKRCLFALSFLVVCSINIYGQMITTIAGCGSCSSLGDGGQATAASIGHFCGLALDKSGNVYIADGNHHRVRKVDISSGIITTVAGTGVMGYNGDGIAATSSNLNWPVWIAIDTSDNLFIEDGGNYRIRKVNSSTGIITTYAGNGIAGYHGDGVAATNAMINGTQGIASDLFGNLYLNDGQNHRVRKINSAGIISTVAGTGVISNTGDGGIALSATLSGLLGICVDVGGSIYTTVNSAAVRRIDKTTGIISRVAGTGDNVATPYLGDGIQATNSHVSPFGVATDHEGNLYIADYENHRIEKAMTSGIIYTIAGNGISGYSGDGGHATGAQLSHPENIVVDKCNNIYIADFNNKRVRKITFNPLPCDYLSINEQSNQTTISTYPNPAKTTFVVTSSIKINTISITNVLGDVMVKEQCAGNEKVEVSISHLPPGVYLVRVNDVYVQKLVKE